MPHLARGCPSGRLSLAPGAGAVTLAFMAREVELKYSSPSGDTPTVDELRAAFAGSGYELSAGKRREQVDVYYDDPERSLERHGLALRDRQIGARHVAALKGRGSAVNGLHERDEFELEMATAPPPWPQELVARLRGVADLNSLRPRMRVATMREAFVMRRADVAVAELSFDEVTCTPLPASGADWSIDEARFNEVELEAKAASVDGLELRAIGAVLEGLLPLNFSDISKLERASALLAPFAND